MRAKLVKKLISNKMTNRKDHVSVMLGECDDDMDRIHIKYPHMASISLNPILSILKKHNFKVHQIISWWFPGNNTILLIREPTKITVCSECKVKGGWHDSSCSKVAYHPCR